MDEHNHHSEVRALEVGLPYLLKHNKEHIEDINKWINRAKQAGYNEVANDLQKVLELSQEITKHLESALKKLKG
ncbi:MAG: hypothetical protein COS84_04495 [Armatimonadetes bacterium CG07_land_8_20_14_0_80_40_9]|nr:MAG: hypothetical protein COS84_04495 [Armatimonadetes bacterium CG07_land_8_20_14_0_80_40_9]